MRKRRAKYAVAIGLAVAGGYGFWHFSFPYGEAKRWEGCVGKPLSACTPPADYDSIVFPCPEFLECRSGPSGESYASSTLLTHRGTFWCSYAYAVIALDKDGRVSSVEIKRFYSAF